MSAERLLIILAIIMFAIGALAPAFPAGGGPRSPRSINWLCAGFAFLSATMLFNLQFK